MRRRFSSHYETGPRPIGTSTSSARYAGAHPWEDWAETWAHYLHMTDTLETAAACGVSIRPRRADEPLLNQAPPERPVAASARSIGSIESWLPLTYVLNNLNRGLGLPDAYPFVLSPPVDSEAPVRSRGYRRDQRDRASVAAAGNIAQRAD